MPLRVIGYHRVRDIEEELSKRVEALDSSPIFLVPSPGDRELLRDIILDGVSFGSGGSPVLRWEDLYREVLRELDIPPEEMRRQIDPPDHWLIVRHVLDEFNAREKDTSVPPGARKRGFVWTLGENLRELLREEVTPDSLAASMDCHSPRDCLHCPFLSAPHGLLCRLYRDYLAYLGSHSLADSAQTATITRITISRHPEKASKWIRQHTFIFAGFMSFTHSQSGLIREMSRMGGDITVFMPENGLDIHSAREQLEDVHPTHFSSDPHDPVPTLMLSAGDHRLELETVLRNLALWSSGEGEFATRLYIPFPGWGNIGLSVEKERLDPAEEILGRYRIPYVSAGGPKVSQTPLWQTAASALEAKHLGFPPEETSHLLSQSWISPEGFPLTKALAEGPRGEEEWRAFLGKHGNSNISDNFTRIAAFCSSIKRGGTPSGLLRALRSLAGDGDVSVWGISLAGFVISNPELDESARRLNAAVRELDQKLERVADMERDIGPAGSAVLKGADAVAFLSAWADRSTVWQPPRSRESLNLYAGSPPVLAHHPIFLVTGLTANAWPGKLSESPLLDDRHKETLHRNPDMGLSPVHLPLLQEKRRQREALLRRIIAAADDLCIASRPRQDSSGRPLLPSVLMVSAFSADKPWIDPIGGDPPFARSMKDVLPGECETVISGIEVRENDHPRYPGRLSALPPSTPWPCAMDLKAPMSGIDTWMECPYKFYAERVLGFEKRRTYGFDPLTAGTMIHYLWEKVWEEKLSSGGDLYDLAGKFWDETVHEKYRDLEKLPRHLNRLHAQTGNMARLQQDIENAGLAGIRTGQIREQSFSMTVGGIPFSGRYDRLDILQDGTAIIVDYKTGRGNGLSRSLQLAAYAAALKEAGSIVVSGYIFLSQGDCRVTGRVEGSAASILGRWTGRPRTTLGDMTSLAGKTMEEMAASISESRFIPNYDNTQACRFCDFQGLCRRGETTGNGGGDDDDGND